jgi:hypothetical protein
MASGAHPSTNVCKVRASCAGCLIPCYAALQFLFAKVTDVTIPTHQPCQQGLACQVPAHLLLSMVLQACQWPPRNGPDPGYRSTHRVEAVAGCFTFVQCARQAPRQHWVMVSGSTTALASEWAPHAAAHGKHAVQPALSAVLSTVVKFTKLMQDLCLNHKATGRMQKVQYFWSVPAVYCIIKL